ncbi:tRNA (guanine-N1)-methyltransferase [Pseudofulvibacter geojedonensis]|uniref:tRNA (Guanine-N1)-methyltransferase n=1 Tax=Pseudofulvibacter geojedonensis TaxID=1123758 RepID=A0ABW3HZ58_9FLAO
MKRIYLLAFALLLNSIFVFAQKTESKNNLTTGNITEKFNYVINESNNYQEFKVVKRSWLHTLKQQVTDSIKVQKAEINSLNNTIASQQEKNTSLNSKINELNTTITQINSDKENINFIGMDIKKESFKSVFWSITSALALLLMFFIYKFNNSNSVTKQTKAQLADIEKEFEDHRRSALEREQKVMRKLQDELNKNKA